MFRKTEKSEKEDEKIAANIVQLVEDLGNKRLLLRFLWVCIFGNAFIWLSVLVLPNLVDTGFSVLFEFSDKLGIGALGIPFGFGLYTAYCLCRLKFPDVEDNKSLDSEILSSFNYQLQSKKRWFIWLFSILVGVFNVVSMVLTTLFLNNRI
jgi:hypothetical protein